MKSKFLQKLHFVLLTLSLSILGNWSKAQMTVQIGSGTSTNSFFPLYTCFVYNYSQQIYLASELNAGGASGPTFIHKIRFKPMTSIITPTSYWQDWQLFLGNTTVDGLATTTSWQTGLTPVFNGIMATPVANNWLEFVLPTPFLWDGISNLVVATYENSANYSCTQSWASYAATPPVGGGNRGRLFYSDPTNPNPSAPPAANYSSDNIAQVQFEMVPATPCAGMPNAGTVIPLGPLATCAGAQTVLTDTGSTLAQNITYQWEESTNGGVNWNNIFGATTKSYPAQPTVTTQYRLKVTCTNSNMTATSNDVTINVTQPSFNAIPYVEEFETWVNKCATYDVPTGGNWVNGPTSGSASWRRVNQGTNGAWIVPNGGAYAPTGIPTIANAGSARFHSSYSTVGAVGNLDLYLDFSSIGGAKQLYFYHINNASLYGTVGVDSLNVFYSTNGGANFTWVGGYDTALTWRKRSIALTTNPNSPQVVIRFQGKRLPAHNVADSNTTDMGIDSIFVTGPCSGAPFAGTIVAPASLCAGSVTNLTTTGTTMAAGLSFQWEQSTNGTTWVSAVGGEGANTQFYQTPSLYDTISYRLKVGCGASFSTTAPITINVASPHYANVPYQQSFELWRNRCALYEIPDSVWATSPPTTSIAWRRRDQGATGGWTNATQGATTPLSLAGAGTYSARFHSTNGAATTTGKLDLLLDCSQQIGSKQLEFHYINPNGNDSLFISYSVDSGFNFTRLSAYNTTPTWTEEHVTIPSNSPKTIVRFEGYADYAGSAGTDISIDSVRVLQPCNAPISAGIINNLSTSCKYDTFTLYLIGNTQAAGLVYDWQQSFDNVNWTSTGVTTFNYTGFITQPTFFRTLVKCVTANIEDTTPVQFVDTTIFYKCYCNSFATTISGADVGNVAIKSLPGNNYKLNNGTITPPTAIVNNSTANKTYTSFINTLLPATMYLDTLYNIAVTQINSGAYTNARVRVWIDKDHSGTFDINEIVLQKFTSTSSTPPQVVDSNFILPSTMDTGITGMRVQVEEGTSPANNACGNYTGGETEDYLIRVYYPPCTGLSNPGVVVISDTSACIGHTIFVTDTTYDKAHSGLIRVWQQSPDGVSWADIPGSDTLNQIKHVVTGVVYFRMQMVCASPVKLDTTHTNVVGVSINPPVSCYCQSQTMGTKSDSSDIGAFYFQNFNNNVGGPHLKNPEAWRLRTDYTRQPSPDLWVDSTYSFTLYHILNSATHADAKVTIFIDFDADMHYDIPAERAFTGFTSASGYLLNGTVTIPHNALPDLPTGMRVILNNDIGANPASDSACGIYTSGETEDYVVVIRSPLTSVNNVKKIGHFNLFPNPNDGHFSISFSTGKHVENTKLTVTNVVGVKIIEKEYGKRETSSTFHEELNLSTVAKGVYFVELQADQERIVRKVVVQ